MENNELLQAMGQMLDEKLPKILDERLPKILDERLPKILDERLPKILDEKLDKIDARLKSVEKNVKKIDARLKNVDKRLINVELRLENKIIPSLEVLSEGHETLAIKVDGLRTVCYPMSEKVDLIWKAVGRNSAEINILKSVNDL